ncbi:hypothetical protein [Chachezhania antarctica]|uniref:hypothetical protein n=1 Tax=Chachezhania antarctica TaxID=2340860 RepID=UPI000EAC0B35|nr:hypothetical protein [Chachezhania antarctica]|tara:strand:- start:341 stop:619 length:279 start_codon:yes stop_codon:yes gene_type:complete
MSELLGLGPEEVAIVGAGLGAFIGTIVVTIRGVKKGKPTSAAVAAAVSGASCRAGDIAPVLAVIQRDLQEMSEKQDEHGRVLAVLEDRTRSR